MGEMIFTEEQLNRIDVKQDEGIEKVTVDVHGLGCREAKTFLRNIIAINREPFKLDVIHGYNHGMCIKVMLLNETVSERVTEVRPWRNNLGKTTLMVA